MGRRRIEEEDEEEQDIETPDPPDVFEELENSKRREEKVLADRKKWAEAQKRKAERYEDWSYKCVCLERGCDWKAVWENSETWKRGAARDHADTLGHRVQTQSTKIIKPRFEANANKFADEPGENDTQSAYCNQCKKFIGVNAGKFFNAAVKAHLKKTKHDVTVRVL